MYTGLCDHELDILKAQRFDFLWGCANVVSAICFTAGKVCDKPPSLGEIFAQMTGEPVPVEPVAEVEDGPGCESLAAAWNERKAREDAAKAAAS